MVVVGLLLLVVGAVGAPAGALTDTTGFVCNNQKARADQDCEGANKHGTITSSIDGNGDLVLQIDALGSFGGWKQLYLCIPGTTKTNSADCQGNTASVLHPQPQPGGAYDVTTPASNTENDKDVSFACSKSIRAVVDSSVLGTGGTVNWTVHVNTCGGGTDEAFGSTTVSPPPANGPTYACSDATDVGQTTATLHGSTTDADVTRALFRFTAPAGETRTFEDADASDGFSAAVTGLTPNTVYTSAVDFFQGAAVRARGTGSGCGFTTNATPDRYACTTPTDVTATSAVLRGSTSNTEVDAATFHLSSSGAAGKDVPGAAGSGGSWTGSASGLTPSTSYTYTVDFTDGGDAAGSGAGSECAFTTAAEAPTVLGEVLTKAPETPGAVAPAAVAVAPAAATAPATLPRTGGVATGALSLLGLALVLLGGLALAYGGLGRPAGAHYRA